jgi:hypothetical protein
MIKITNPDLDAISKWYFEEIKDKIIKRASIIIDIINFVDEQNDSLVANIDLHKWSTVDSLVRLLTTEELGKIDKEDKKKRIESKTFTYKSDVKVIKDDLIKIASYFACEQNLEQIILAKPKELEKIANGLGEMLNFQTCRGDSKCSKLKSIKKIIDYDSFLSGEPISFELTQKLGVQTCPYCNRSPIHTVITGKKGLIKPTLDHFFPQSKYPELALSFYNLIPSCYYCNSSLKHSKEIKEEWHLNPYVDGFGDDVSFSVLPKGLLPQKSNSKNYTITFQKASSFELTTKGKQIFGGPTKDKCVNEKQKKPALITGNIRLFKLKEIYQVHTDVVGELLVKCDKYHAIKENLKGFSDILGNTNKELYNFYFANHLDIEDHHKRPLAKLTRDIILSELSEEFE